MTTVEWLFFPFNVLFSVSRNLLRRQRGRSLRGASRHGSHDEGRPRDRKGSRSSSASSVTRQSAFAKFRNTPIAVSFRANHLVKMDVLLLAKASLSRGEATRLEKRRSEWVSKKVVVLCATDWNSLGAAGKGQNVSCLWDRGEKNQTTEIFLVLLLVRPKFQRDLSRCQSILTFDAGCLQWELV